MKRLYLLRHAKSSWKDPELADYDRPLNKRGKRDAPFMGQRLKKQGVRPDIILSSPAKRARRTAKLIAQEIDYPPKQIQWLESLYAAGSESMLQIISEIDDGFSQVLLVGHNPGLTDLAERLTGTLVDNIPTAGVMAIDFEIESWANMMEGSGTVVFFDYPKKHPKAGQ